MSEPLDIKERTFEFALLIVELSRFMDELPGTSQHLAAPLLRSGVAVGASVEEAHSGLSKPDFIARMSTAEKEARETNYWLRLLAASGLVDSSRLAVIIDESQQLIAILTTIVKRSREHR